jgi:hypothetical protein
MPKAHVTDKKGVRHDQLPDTRCEIALSHLVPLFALFLFFIKGND